MLAIDKWNPVTMAWCILRLQMEEASKCEEYPLKKQSQTADKGWSSSFGVGQGANNSSL